MKKRTARDFSEGREVLVNSALVCAVTTIVGTVSNVLLMAVGFLISMPVSMEGYTAENDRRLWLFLAVTSMLVTVGLGVGVHGLLCAALSWSTIAYLFIAGPVQYIARFLGRGRHSIFIDEAFDFPKEMIWAALGIYLALLFVSCLVGYAVGFGKKIRTVEQKEREDAASARWEARKVEREVYGSGSVSNVHREESAPKPQIKRETLSGKTEKGLRELNRNKILGTAAFIVLWTAGDVLLRDLWSVWSGREMLSPTAVTFTLLLIVPFYPLKKHEVFLGKTYYAEVVDVRTEEEAVAGTGRYGRGVSKRYRRVVFLRPKGGVTEKLVFPEKAMLDFKPGDHVLKLSAFKFPVNCNFDEDRDVYCPNCGHSSPKSVPFFLFV